MTNDNAFTNKCVCLFCGCAITVIYLVNFRCTKDYVQHKLNNSAIVEEFTWLIVLSCRLATTAPPCVHYMFREISSPPCITRLCLTGPYLGVSIFPVTEFFQISPPLGVIDLCCQPNCAVTVSSSPSVASRVDSVKNSATTNAGSTEDIATPGQWVRWKQLSVPLFYGRMMLNLWEVQLPLW